MKRTALLNKIILFMNDDDLVLFSNNMYDIYNTNKDKIHSFYFENPGLILPFSIGLAMNTTKNVFVICEDIDLLYSFDVLPQIAVSKCTNIFLIVVGCGLYQESGGQYSIKDSIKSFGNSIFSLGFYMYEFSNHVKNGKFSEIVAILKKSTGPIYAHIKVDYGVKPCKNLEIDRQFMMDNILNFVNGTSPLVFFIK